MVSNILQRAGIPSQAEVIMMSKKRKIAEISGGQSAASVIMSNARAKIKRITDDEEYKCLPTASFI